MDVFLLGVFNVLSAEVGLLLILSFLLIGKLSKRFSSHLLKIFLICVTTILFYVLFFSFGPTAVFIFFMSSVKIILILTVLLCVKLLGVLQYVRNKGLHDFIEDLFNWLAPFLIGCWFFTLSLASLGLVLRSSLGSTLDLEVPMDVMLIPLLYGFGVATVVGIILIFAWFFHDKFKGMQFWKIIQVLALIATLIYTLRIFIAVLVA